MRRVLLHEGYYPFISDRFCFRFNSNKQMKFFVHYQVSLFSRLFQKQSSRHKRLRNRYWIILRLNQLTEINCNELVLWADFMPSSLSKFIDRNIRFLTYLWLFKFVKYEIAWNFHVQFIGRQSCTSAKYNCQKFKTFPLWTRNTTIFQLLLTFTLFSGPDIYSFAIIYRSSHATIRWKA